ncbi:uncharacterized protein G2W53_037075 [Senna tora]|uniref:Uncharacterized protein n=1 Tax=Senna tora TaxID=362788 RepID=A0A834SYK0_9FABA|nr:uncharacterized protein G2W53_037075 [Senna tora]
MSDHYQPTAYHKPNHLWLVAAFNSSKKEMEQLETMDESFSVCTE